MSTQTTRHATPTPLNAEPLRAPISSARYTCKRCHDANKQLNTLINDIYVISPIYHLHTVDFNKAFDLEKLLTESISIIVWQLWNIETHSIV